MLISVGACSNAANEQGFTSPDGTYTVHVRGKSHVPFIGFVRSSVDLKVSKAGHDWITWHSIFSSDPMETFSDRYGSPRWITPNTLRFPSIHSVPLSHEVVIRNRSAHSFRALQIRAHDFTFVFDVSVGARFSLPMTSQRRSGTTSIVVSAIRDDGVRLKDQYADFDRPDDTDSVRVGIEITDQSILIVLDPPKGASAGANKGGRD